MTWIRAVAREVFGLFVDDGAFAVAIVVWVVLLAMLLPHIGGRFAAGGIVLALGLGGILAESTWRYARGKQRR